MNLRRRCRWRVMLLLVLLGGCDPVVEIDPPSVEPMLVVQSVFHPGQTDWYVEVGAVSGLDAPGGSNDPDAVVEIMRRGEVLARAEHRERSTYVAPGLAPEHGETYTVRVRAPGYPPAEASSTVPRPATNLRATFRPSAPQGRAGFEIAFDDPAGRDDFYALLPYEDVGMTIPLACDVDHPAISPEMPSIYDRIKSDGTAGLQRNAFAVPFRDETFDGTRFEATLSFDRMPVYAYRFELAQLSAPLYRFSDSVRRAERADAEENPLSEPVLLYSNVAGGHGVVAGYLIQTLPPTVLDEVTPQLVSGTWQAEGHAQVDEPSDTTRHEWPDYLDWAEMRLVLTPARQMEARIRIFDDQRRDDVLVDTSFAGSYLIDRGAIILHEAGGRRDDAGASVDGATLYLRRGGLRLSDLELAGRSTSLYLKRDTSAVP